MQVAPNPEVSRGRLQRLHRQVLTMTHDPQAPSPPAWGKSTVDQLGDAVDRHSDIFFAAVQTTRMPMVVTDPHAPDNPIIFANPAFLAMTGYQKHEVVGQNCRFLQGPETDPSTVAEVRAAVADRRDFATEILNYRSNGSSFWNALFISPVLDHAGELVYWFSSQLDVSRRRDAEEALSQAQHMEALGQLTGGIAHDFNNLLQVVVGYLDSLRLQLSSHGNPKVDRALLAIGEAAHRATTLTQQLLAFARKQRLEGRSINLNDLVLGMSELARRTLGDAITLATDLERELWICRLDATQAELALLNLLINARDAMPTGGRVSIETRNVAVDAHHPIVSMGVQPGRHVMIAISDTGTGMSSDLVARATEPFFTTKQPGRATGLGLAMVHGFVKQSRGGVDIESVEGRGTTVRLYFPAVNTAPSTLLQPRPSGAAEQPGLHTILVVEDRPDVAELARVILEEDGYRVLVRSNGLDALQVLEAGQQVDLMFSDLIMPGGMNGVMLAREVRQRYPRVKVLLTTGYAEASLERADAGGSEFEIINKPYRRMELLRRVRATLGGPNAAG